MCLGIPGEVVEIHDPVGPAGVGASAGSDVTATVDVSGVRRAISLALLADEPVAVGDWVLVHVGFAMSRIDADEAQATLDQIKLLGQAYTDELDAFKQTEIR